MKNMNRTVLDGNLLIMRAYNRHGMEKDKVVEIVCDMDVETEYFPALS